MSRITAPWAKTNRKKLSDPEFRWLGVLPHSIDVAASLGVLLKGNTRRRIEAAAGRPLAQSDVARLQAILFLHDVGKYLKGFQDKLFGGAPGLFDGHVGQMLHLIELAKSGAPAGQLGGRLIDLLGLKEVARWFPDFPTACDALTLVFSHHGGYSGPETSKEPLKGQGERTVLGHDPLEGIERHGRAAVYLFPEAFWDGPLLPVTHAFWHAAEGLFILADWIASTNSPEWRGGPCFPLDGEGGTPRDRLAESTKTAERILEGTGFHGAIPRETPPDPLFATNGKPLRPLQQAVNEIPPDRKVIVVEAPTGEGKTEAALIRFLVLHAADQVDGLYFAVPTRAAGVQLHGRIHEFVRRVHYGSPPVTLAVPGSPQRMQDYHPDPGRWKTWSSDYSARFLTSGVGVGTVDQALLSALLVSSTHARAAATLRLLLVVDEVHSSDPYMLAALRALALRHVTLGGHILFMSATLGSTALAEILGREPPPFAEARDAAYPLLTSGVSFDDAVSAPFPHDQARERIVRMRRLRPDRLLDTLRRAVDQGARVLLVRSTVRDALRDQTTLQAAGIPTLLVPHVSNDGVFSLAHHSRFAKPDRAVLDSAIEETLRPSRFRMRSGVVVVTTQTAEQSLDIDSDLLVTDPCPADVLIQRIGRLHRHKLPRPERFVDPWCLVLDPGDLGRYLDPDGDITWVLEGMGFPWVYRNLLSVSETMRWVDAGRLIQPSQSRAMVEDSTHAAHLRTVAEGLGIKWVKLWDKLYGEQDSHRALGLRSSVAWTAAPVSGRNAIRSDEDIRTRIGADTVDVATDFVSFLGNRIENLPVPESRLKGADPDRIDRAVVLGTDGPVVILDIGGKQFTYGPRGLERVDGMGLDAY
jgi:CRISPR-associated endonuclease/helicase Cas3